MLSIGVNTCGNFGHVLRNSHLDHTWWKRTTKYTEELQVYANKQRSCSFTATGWKTKDLASWFAGKALRFQTQTSTSYVRLYPSNCPNLSAFTLCFRAASEASHSYTLFSYATSNHNNELLIWKGDKGRMCLYLGNIVVGFSLPEMNALLRHICVTWESTGGLATFWVDGERSIWKVGKKGGIVHGGGAIILVQEQEFPMGIVIMGILPKLKKRAKHSREKQTAAVKEKGDSS
ncbi:mucosal pentraxin-like [Carcharodon carcharias]|uniref:mucosal pentraxin-like n=1 Tax=Carcharodon carcharias TaxID=13397 RepID=UPI001B7E87F6|nr:mucosal pentraxin-like [Carcharodon carcharias]